MVWSSRITPTELPKAKGELVMKEPSILEIVNNRIYFYADIDRDTSLRLNKELKQKESDILHDTLINDRKESVNIFLHINSYGGSVFHGFSILDNLVTCKVPIITIVDGCAASSATLFSVAGKRRYIHKHSFMLIHQISSIMWGKYAECQDEMKNQDILMKTIKDIYKEYTSLPMKKLDEIMSHDLWFDATQCLNYKLVDEILK